MTAPRMGNRTSSLLDARFRVTFIFLRRNRKEVTMTELAVPVTKATSIHLASRFEDV